MSPGEFVNHCISELFRVAPELTPFQVFEVVANVVVETGWGKYRRGNNLGGWKITKGAAGPGIRWFRAHGNKAPGATPGHLAGGDPPWCYYRVFESFGQYFIEWLLRFVPKPGTVPASHRYYKAGQQFWSGQPWFDDLCAAGYKGENTKARPQGSIIAHEQITERITKMYVQHVLGLEPDGDWGPKSTRAAKEKGWSPTGQWSSDLFMQAFHTVNPGCSPEHGANLRLWCEGPPPVSVQPPGEGEPMLPPPPSVPVNVSIPVSRAPAASRKDRGGSSGK